jgi:hypothetical protein
MKLFGLLVLVGCLGELFADGAIFALSSRLQVISNIEIARLNNKAEQAVKDSRQLAIDLANANSALTTKQGDRESKQQEYAREPEMERQKTARFQKEADTARLAL